MPYPSNVDMTNQYLTQQAFKAERDRVNRKESERISKSYYDSLSSSRASSSSRAPVSHSSDYKELKKKFAEEDKQFYRSLGIGSSSSSNTSRSSSKSTNFFSSWFGKK